MDAWRMRRRFKVAILDNLKGEKRRSGNGTGIGWGFV